MPGTSWFPLDPQQGNALDEVIPAVRSAAASRTALVARASATSRWIWLSGAGVPDPHHVEKAMATADRVRLAGGRPGHGLKGSGPATRTCSRRRRWSSGSGPAGASPPMPTSN